MTDLSASTADCIKRCRKVEREREWEEETKREFFSRKKWISTSIRTSRFSRCSLLLSRPRCEESIFPNCHRLSQEIATFVNEFRSVSQVRGKGKSVMVFRREKVAYSLTTNQITACKNERQIAVLVGVGKSEQESPSLSSTLFSFISFFVFCPLPACTIILTLSLSLHLEHLVSGLDLQRHKESHRISISSRSCRDVS